MKKYVNGKLIEMTPEEIEELRQLSESTPAQPPTEAERLEALEAAMLELAGVVANG